jgi:hypothetical protein
MMLRLISPPFMLHLAQATRQYSPTPVLVWVGVLIACAVVGGMVVVLLRKKMLDQQTATDISGSLMEHLRDAHARGEITDAEYEQARKSMASRVSQVMDTKRGGGLFELPEPKRRLRPASSFGKPFDASAVEPPSSTGPGTDELRAPPGYDLTGAPLPRPPQPE